MQFFSRTKSRIRQGPSVLGTYTKILRINVVKLHDGELVDGGRQFLTLFEKKSGASRRSLAHKTAASVLSREQLLFRALRLVTTLFCHNAEVTCEAIHKLSHYSIWGPGGRGSWTQFSPFITTYLPYCGQFLPWMRTSFMDGSCCATYFDGFLVANIFRLLIARSNPSAVRGII